MTTTTTDTDPASEGSPGPPVSHARSIARQAGSGLRWTLVGTFATKVGSFAMSLVLARLLVPADFGLYAIALAATQFVMHVNDAGIIAATVQWRGKLEDMAPTATTLALLFSVGWYTVFWFGAPVFADLAGSPEAAPLVRLLTAVILIDGVTAVRVAALQRRFQQDKLMIAITAGFVVNASLAITLAANGAGAYSFVIGQMAASVVTGVCALTFARLPFRLRIDRPVAARLVRFGVPLAVGLGIESVLVYADSVIVGHALGPVMLGFYLLAFNISSWVPGLVTTAVRYVSVSGFSRLAEHKHEALSTGVRHAVPLLVTAVVPLAVVLGTLAPEVVVFLYGPEWEPAGAALRFLAVVMVARVFLSLCFDILTSMGATRTTALLNLVWALVLIPALWLGTDLDGIAGAALAHAVVAVVVAIPLGVLALRRCGVHLGPAVPAILWPLAGGTAAGVAIVAVSELLGSSAHPFVELVLAGGAGMVVYVAFVLRGAQRHELFRRIKA